MLDSLSNRYGYPVVGLIGYALRSTISEMPSRFIERSSLLSICLDLRPPKIPAPTSVHSRDDDWWLIGGLVSVPLNMRVERVSLPRFGDLEFLHDLRDTR